MQKLRVLLCACVVATWAGALRADVKLAVVFSDHMVLQREQKTPIFGEAKAGEKVTVKFRDQEKSATADEDGKWMVKLDPLVAGGPDKLIVSSANTIAIDDVLVGEVWVGSGQSNMAMIVREFTKLDPPMLAVLERTPYPKIRHFGIAGPWQTTCDSKWHIADEKSTPVFSALLFAFGLRLQQDLDVPVGLILAARSGSPAGYWISKSALEADASCQEQIRKFAQTWKEDAGAIQRYETAIEKWNKDAAILKQQKQPLPPKPYPPAKPGEAIGTFVGDAYETYMRPVMPYAIRGVLWDQGENAAGIVGITDYSALMNALINGWRREWGQGDFPFIYVQKESGGGCAWNDSNPVTPNAEKFAPYPDVLNTPIADAFIRMMRIPNTGMVISSDLGAGLHPSNKSGYGHRAADVALGMVYDKKIEYYGPLYSSHKIEGGKIRVSFTHVGKGLAFKGGDKLTGFAISNGSRFLWADAEIDGDTVMLSNPKVPKPVAVQYGWCAKRPWANFFNKDGLPAIPFKTE